MNETIITVFEKLIQEKQKEITNLKKNKDQNKKEISQLNFKVINFRKGLKAIKEYPNKIVKGEDLIDINGIGKGIITRINEILKEGTLVDEIKPDMNSNLQFSELKNYKK